MKDRRILTPETGLWLFKMLMIVLLVILGQIVFATATPAGIFSVSFAIVTMFLIEIKSMLMTLIEHSTQILEVFELEDDDEEISDSK